MKEENKLLKINAKVKHINTNKIGKIIKIPRVVGNRACYHVFIKDKLYPCFEEEIIPI